MDIGIDIAPSHIMRQFALRTYHCAIHIGIDIGMRIVALRTYRFSIHATIHDGCVIVTYTMAASSPYTHLPPKPIGADPRYPTTT